MKKIKRYFFALLASMFLLWACAPKEFDNYSLGDYTKITEDMIQFNMTQGSDEWTYDYSITGANPEKTPFSYEIRFGNGGVSKELTGSYEYISYAGTFNVECIISTVDGYMFVKTKEIILENDNPKALIDDPTSLQFALTGGRDNINGKQWQLGPWTAMRDPNDRGAVWWDGYKHDAILDDIFTFIPDNVFPYGAFAHDNHGDSFLNQAFNDMFGGTDPDNSFVTSLYTPANDATWKVSESGGKMFLTIYKGFLGYGTSPNDLVEAVYEVISFSTTSILLSLVDGWGGWCYELISEKKADPLTGFGEKTWIIDANNERANEVRDATGLNIRGHMGLGPINANNQEWWGAGAQEKSFENTLGSVGKGWTLYNWKITFTSSKTLHIVTEGEGYGRKAFDGQGFTSNTIQGDDMIFAYNGGDYTYTLASGDPYQKLTLSGDAFLGYYAGTQEYEILYVSQTALAVVAHNTTENQDWVLVFTPDEGQIPEVENWVPVQSEDNLWYGVTFTNTFYYAPNWSALPTPNLVISGSQYSVNYPTATSDQWQNQIAFVTDGLATTAGEFYDFRVTLKASNNIRGVTVKLTQADDDNVFIVLERVDLTAGEEFIVKVKNAAGQDMPQVKLVFDFGGNPANTDVVIKDVILQKHID